MGATSTNVLKSLAFANDDVLIAYQCIANTLPHGEGGHAVLCPATPHPHPAPGSIPPLHRGIILACHTLPRPGKPIALFSSRPKNFSLDFSGTYIHRKIVVNGASP
jgi:hypothetical protein